MKRLTAAAPLLAAALLCAPAYAHHSQAMFDTSKEIVIEGKISRFDWTNPHMYLTVETKGPDGKPALVEGEGLGITQALVDGLKREDLSPARRSSCAPIRIAAAGANKCASSTSRLRTARFTRSMRRITRTRTLTPAESLAGHWAPNRAALGAGFGAMARCPLTPEARAAQTKLAADGLCYVEPIPFLAVLDELRTIEIGKDEVVMNFDNTGDRVDRIIHMNAQHPANVQPSRQGHSIGRWDGETLVIDTIAFEPNPSGLGANVPSSPRKHTVERLTLIPDHTRLRYEVTVEDPVYLTGPGTLTQQWDHRPDLEFAQDDGKCDPNAAVRYKKGL